MTHKVWCFMMYLFDLYTKHLSVQCLRAHRTLLDACYSQVIMLSGCAVFIVYNMTEVERERGRERERETEREGERE